MRAMTRSGWVMLALVTILLGATGLWGQVRQEIQIPDIMGYKTLKCDLHIANFSYATPLPSSRLWEQAEREGLFVEGFDLANITYDKPSLKSKNWTIDELQSLVLSMSRRFYLKTFLRHPKIILFRIIDGFKRNPLTLFRIIFYRLIRQ